MCSDGKKNHINLEKIKNKMLSSFLAFSWHLWGLLSFSSFHQVITWVLKKKIWCTDHSLSIVSFVHCRPPLTENKNLEYLYAVVYQFMLQISIYCSFCFKLTITPNQFMFVVSASLFAQISFFFHYRALRYIDRKALLRNVLVGHDPSHWNQIRRLR